MSIKYIDSFTNPTIKLLRSLQSKKFILQNQLFLVEGKELINKALAYNWRINHLVFVPELASPFDIKIKAQKLIATNMTILAKITKKDNPQPIIATFKPKQENLSNLKPSSQTILALDNIKNPGNLGTIIRTCEAFNIKNIILIGDSVYPFSFECSKSTMGSIFSVNIYQTSEQSFISWLKNNDFDQIIATDPSSGQDFRKINYKDKKNIIIMGNESNGISHNIFDNCNIRVNIPQQPSLDSLNLSIATALIIYEAHRHAL